MRAGLAAVAFVLASCAGGNSGSGSSPTNGSAATPSTILERPVDGVVECPLGYVIPETGQRIVYTPPCTRQTEDGGYLIRDGQGFAVLSVTH